MGRNACWNDHIIILMLWHNGILQVYILTLRANGFFNTLTKGRSKSTHCRLKKTTVACTTTPKRVLQSKGSSGDTDICFKVPPCWFESSILAINCISLDRKWLSPMKVSNEWMTWDVTKVVLYNIMLQWSSVINTTIIPHHKSSLCSCCLLYGVLFFQTEIIRSKVLDNVIPMEQIRIM